MSSANTGADREKRDERGIGPLPSWVFPVLSLLAAGSLLAQHGYSLGLRVNFFFDYFDILLGFGFAAEVLLSVWLARRKREALHTRRFELGMLAGLLGSVALVWSGPEISERFARNILGLESVLALHVGLIKLYLLAMIFVQILKILQGMLLRSVRPEVVLGGSLLSLILLGTALLLLPRAMAEGSTLSFVDAFFTATSAACVTGLLVRDIAEFSNLGQATILALVQVGGLGIITFVAFLSVFSARTLPVSQMIAFRQVINTPALGDLKSRLAGVFAFTFLVEAVGAICLFLLFTGESEIAARLKWSIWHSIAAFCNAGIALHPDGLVRFVSDPGINLVIMVLVLLGGMGFLVIPEICSVLGRKAGRLSRRIFSENILFRGAPARLGVQARLSLVVSFWLIVVGSVAFLLLEWNHLFAEAAWDKTALVSVFHSVVIRTAGFNTVPIDQLRDATVLLLMILMSIGASPVSVGGGIKTVTFGVLLLAMRSMLLSQDRVEVFGRTIPGKVIVAALSVFVLYIMTAAIATLLLATFEPVFNIRAHLLETISALSTAGLSTGVTPQLSTPGKLLLCAVMFIGRIGPISLVVSVFRARAKVDYEFPAEEVVVG